MIPSARRLLASALAAASLARALDFSALDAYIRAEMDLNQVPGLSLGIVQNGAILSTRAYGLRSLRTRQPMTVETPVDLASLSKSFTALAVLGLHEAGRLDLDAPVAQYLPDFRAPTPVTVRDLLRHTSGLTRQDDYLIPCCGQPGEGDLDFAVRRLQAARFRPLEPASFRYANSNYVLLAALVERVSGEPFPQYMQARVFDPLGLPRTTLGRAAAREWGLADYHERQWGTVDLSSSRFSGWYGASMVVSTANDMARYVLAILHSGKPLPEPPYDAGWLVHHRLDWLDGAAVLEHSGDIWGANTAAILAPSRRLGVVVLINAGVNRAPQIARAVLARTAGVAAPPPARAPRADDPDFWAISAAVAASLILLFLAAWLLRLAADFRRGNRRFVPQFDPWPTARSTLLIGMAAYLIYLVAWTGRPLAGYPASLRIALPLLASASAALLALAALAGLCPHRPKAAETHAPD